jgi:sec-independent protein translocase protein TatC
MNDPATAAPSAPGEPPIDPIDEQRFTLMEHLTELRKRLFWSLVAVIVGTIACAYFVDEVFHFLVQPITPYLPPPGKLVVLSPLEQVVAYLRIAVISGVFVASPVIFSQVWGFVAPGLYPREKKFVLPFILFGTLFFLGGAAFGYYVFLPMTFKFLVGVLPTDVVPQYTVEKYFSLVTQLLLAMGAIFEMPLVIGMLSLAGFVSTAQLKKFRRYNIVLAVVVSAVITPTVDPYSQLLMAAPMIAFYEVGILFAWFTERRRKRSQQEENARPE